MGLLTVYVNEARLFDWHPGDGDAAGSNIDLLREAIAASFDDGIPEATALAIDAIQTIVETDRLLCCSDPDDQEFLSEVIATFVLQRRATAGMRAGEVLGELLPFYDIDVRFRKNGADDFAFDAMLLRETCTIH